MEREPKPIPPDEQSLMVREILYMRANSGYPRSQIVIGLAALHRPELLSMAEECVGVFKNSDGDEKKARDQILKRLAMKFSPEIMDLVDKTVDELQKDPTAALNIMKSANDAGQIKEVGPMVETPKAQTEVKPADLSWIEAGEGGWVAKTLEACMAQQTNVLVKFSEDEKKAGYGFACQLMVGKIENREFYECEDGGTFNLYFNDKGVQPKPPEVQVRNVVCIDVDTLFDIIMPDWEQVKASTEEGEVQGLQAVLAIFEDGGWDVLLPQLRPRMTIGEAIANGKILFGGDKPDVDSEMWSKMSEAVLVGLAYPLALKGLIAVAKDQRKK